MNDSLKIEIREKQLKLEGAKSFLKESFFGIDRVIDELISNFSSWYFLSDLQEKPTVINLWGLTGVGKSDLVSKLVQFLNLENDYYRFDLGEKEGELSFRSALDDLSKEEEDRPLIIAFDEIQHSRTIDGPLRKEIENDKNRMIWELIDSGKIQYIDWVGGIFRLENLRDKIGLLKNTEVKVSEGIVINGIIDFCLEMEYEYDAEETYDLIDETYYSAILNISSKFINIQTRKELIDYLHSMDLNESLNFLDQIISYSRRPNVKSFTKSLIFVIGNLDEAFEENGNFNVDIDADIFHRHSLKINIPKIKNALRARFRDEQIARFGNIHIVYPSLSKVAYRKIIHRNLSVFAQQFETKFKLKLEFDKTIHEIIYLEGVYPTQGVRPVITTIQQIIKSNISYFISKMIIRKASVNQIRFKFSDGYLMASFFNNQDFVFDERIHIQLPLSELRKSPKNDRQAITAVHESGHIVLSVILMGKIPEFAFSVTADPAGEGFVLSENSNEILFRKNIKNKAAVMLGGLVAEELVFGKELITVGSSSDIENLTSFLNEMILKNGMGDLPISVSLPQTNEAGDFHHYMLFEEKVKGIVYMARELARITLEKHQDFLLLLADYLSDHSVIHKEKIVEFMNEAVPSAADYLNNKESLRKYLKRKVKDSIYTVENMIGTQSICLNKDC